tara:strand:- start:7743 stop:9239 length:1497 start_codon:yes stop_codon:yes gene_type:complete
MEKKSLKEDRIRKITHLYYSRPDIQKEIFEFSENREISPQYFEGFGKRPDSFQYKGDIFELVKKGATSFHCSEELWENPLNIQTGMNEKQLNELRIGWDLLIDIDCKWFDYSKLAAKAVIEVINNHGIKNIGLKFSGSKGWHILIPWKAFPKELKGVKTKDLFPELPRKVISYIRFCSEKILKESLPEDFYKQFKDVDIKKGIKCNECNEITREYNLTDFFCNRCNIGEQRKLEVGNKEEFRCPHCSSKFNIKDQKIVYECSKCKVTSEENPDNFSKSIEIDLYDLMGLDIILVSPRHLFRMPYSLHEKTALASVVLSPEEISDFQPKDANPVKVKVRDFMPNSKEGEASELLIQALDWYKEDDKKDYKKKKFNLKPIKLENLSDKNFPPSIQKILQGLNDGRKRALFILLNLFRSVGMNKDELEKRIYDWNKKNKIPLKEGYVKSQLSWSYRNKVVPPPNFDKDYYKGIGIIPTEEELRYKNPVNYVVKKSIKVNKK